MPVKIKRAYEEASSDDGVRVLVDRLWPRGISKEKLQIDHWLKDVTPSNELRKWFNHDPDKFAEFKKRYMEELQTEGEQKNQLEELKQLVAQNKKQVTLVYGAKDEEHNQAIILKEILNR